MQPLHHRDLKLRAFASAEQDRMDVASELLFENLFGALFDALEGEGLGALRRGLRPPADGSDRLSIRL